MIGMLGSIKDRGLLRFDFILVFGGGNVLQVASLGGRGVKLNQRIYGGRVVSQSDMRLLCGLNLSSNYVLKHTNSLKLRQLEKVLSWSCITMCHALLSHCSPYGEIIQDGRYMLYCQRERKEASGHYTGPM